MNPQIEGIDEIRGTYPFDILTSVRTLKLNRFFWELRRPEYREAFRAEQEAVLERAGLTEDEKALVRSRDWIGLVRYGISFFVLEKFARVVGLSNLEVYALMRGETFEQFMRTRNVPGAR